jgi:hypothetical protein
MDRTTKTQRAKRAKRAKKTQRTGGKSPRKQQKAGCPAVPRFFPFPFVFFVLFVSFVSSWFKTHYPCRIDSINTRATSGRLNCGGGTSPAASISRTRVPLRVTWCERSCGQVLAEAMASQTLQKKV